MCQWSFHIKLLAVLWLISNSSAVPSPPLTYRPWLFDDGPRHAWHAWDPVDLDPSSLKDYVKMAHAEMYEQAAKDSFTEVDMPCCIASLLIPKKGVYTASDYGRLPAGTVDELLHPQTQALLKSKPLKPGSHGGTYAEIQALDAVHRRFPGESLPAGSCIAIYSSRKSCICPKVLQTCTENCRKILKTKGIECFGDEKKATGKAKSPQEPNPKRVKHDPNEGWPSMAAVSSFLHGEDFQPFVVESGY